jgi:hypothetical protein
MKTVWKYPIDAQEVTLNIPKDYKVLKIEMQRNTPTMWVEVDTDTKEVPKKFKIFGTGWPLDNNVTRHAGSYIQAEGAFVWHVYEVE